MKIPQLNFAAGKPQDMSEAALENRIRRSDKRLAKLPDLGQVVLWSTLLLIPAVGITGLALSSWAFTPLLGVAVLGTAAGAYFGSGYAYNRLVNYMQRTREELMGALETKVEARVEAERLRDLKAADAFNAHVDAGLPLEQSISVKKALRLKFPPPPVPDTHIGFGRIFSPSPRPGRMP